MKKYFISILSITLLLSALLFTQVKAFTLSDVSLLQTLGIITQAQATSLINAINNGSFKTPTAIVQPVTPDCAVIPVDLSYTERDSSKNGSGVSILQDFLNSNGYLSVTPTGYFGRMTVNAVKAFQSANGLSVTGKADSATRAKIQDVDCNTNITTTTTNPSTPSLPTNVINTHIVVSPILPVSNPPSIYRISAPASNDSTVYAGQRFAIDGTNFIAPNSVYVGNESAVVTQDNNVIYAIAPSDLQSGQNYVIVKNANGGVSSQFTVQVFGY